MAVCVCTEFFWFWRWTFKLSTWYYFLFAFNGSLLSLLLLLLLNFCLELTPSTWKSHNCTAQSASFLSTCTRAHTHRARKREQAVSRIFWTMEHQRFSKRANSESKWLIESMLNFSGKLSLTYRCTPCMVHVSGHESTSTVPVIRHCWENIDAFKNLQIMNHHTLHL